MSVHVLLGAIWSIVLLVAMWFVPRLSQALYPASKKQALGWVVVIALLVRLLPSMVLPMGAGYDIESYAIVGETFLQGKDVYIQESTVHRHPYLPLQMYWMALAWKMSEITHQSFVKIVRLFPIGADVGIAVLIYLWFYRAKKLRMAWSSGLLYAVNPISVFVSAYHGQFDALPILFILLALFWVGKEPGWAGMWLGFGILDKSWPVLAMPPMFTYLWRERKGWPAFLGAALIVPLVGVVMYEAFVGTNIAAMLERVLGYNWGTGVWGYTYLFHLAAILQPGWSVVYQWLLRFDRQITLVILFIVWILKSAKEPPSDGVLTTFVVFLAVTHAFSIQYLAWVVPFALVGQDRKWLSRYTLGAFVYMLLTYTTLILEMHVNQWLPWPQADWFIIMPSGLPAWAVTVGWAAARLFR